VKVLADMRDCYDVSVWCHNKLVAKNGHKNRHNNKAYSVLTPRILLKAYDKIQVPNTVAISWSCEPINLVAFQMTTIYRTLCERLQSLYMSL
jgi:hypothetical protein